MSVLFYEKVVIGPTTPFLLGPRLDREKKMIGGGTVKVAQKRGVYETSVFGVSHRIGYTILSLDLL
jgi:allophanate hydrolase subunit 1